MITELALESLSKEMKSKADLFEGQIQIASYKEDNL